MPTRSATVAALLMRRAAGGQAGSLMQLLRDLAAEGVIALAGDAGGAAPHGVGGFEVLDRQAFQRCPRRPPWWGDCEGEGAGVCGRGTVTCRHVSDGQCRPRWRGRLRGWREGGRGRGGGGGGTQPTL